MRLFPLLLITIGAPSLARSETPNPPAQTSPPPAAGTPAKPDPNQAMKDEIARLTAERDKLAAEVALMQTKVDRELADMKAGTARAVAQLADLKAKQDLADFQLKQAQDKELQQLRKEFDRALLESNIAKALVDTETYEMRRLENESRKQTAKISADIELEQKQLESRNYARVEPLYMKDPLQGKKLVISDRRIPLNGPITMATADQITERVNYFNNRDRALPIFIVIDDCPGGSVMAGYKILKAMNGSQAPVYVVVKSFAASMAACITTLAKHSYAYPNAVILHHQIQSFAGGNLTQQQEWVKEMEEWWRRLADPVAQKMGITREEFIKRMYAHASTGDWNEFADNAQKLHWVDTIVEEIEETGAVKHPDTVVAMSPAPQPGRNPGHENVTSQEQRDEKGRLYMTLPRLNPLDCYWIYNPDGYYRQP